MPKIPYEPKNFPVEHLSLIAYVNTVLLDYARQGYNMTLRQIYYVLVARDKFPADRKFRRVGADKWVRDEANGTNNATPNYKWLGGIINDARLAGLIDWDHVKDRTREMKENNHWDSPSSIIDAVAQQYARDKWEGQDNYVEVWVEKNALIDVLEVACKPLDVPYFACIGYTSQSEMWTAAMRLLKKLKDGRHVHIIHLGDHDPSGVDMSRDIEDRIRMFAAYHSAKLANNFHFERIALNMDQIREFNPPPNPAKLTDSRANKYVEEYGDDSWELDALTPDVMNGLISEAVTALRDEDTWNEMVEQEEKEKAQLQDVSSRWEEVVEFINE